jgi:hypothetical protein
MIVSIKRKNNEHLFRLPAKMFFKPQTLPFLQMEKGKKNFCKKSILIFKKK